MGKQKKEKKKQKDTNINTENIIKEKNKTKMTTTEKQRQQQQLRVKWLITRRRKLGKGWRNARPLTEHGLKIQRHGLGQPPTKRRKAECI